MNKARQLAKTLTAVMCAVIAAGTGAAFGFESYDEALQAGLMHSREKEMPEARDAFQAALKLTEAPTEKAEAYLRMGHTYNTRRERRQKMAAYRTVLKIAEATPEQQADAQSSLAQVMNYHAGTFGVEQTRTALSEVLALKDATAEQRTRALLALGDLDVKEERYAAALKYFGQVLELEGIGRRETTWATSRIAGVYSRIGAWSKARPLWEELDNDMEVGMCDYQERRFEEAREAFKRHKARYSGERQMRINPWHNRNASAYIAACDFYIEHAKKGPVDIGSRTELFVDEWLVSSNDNVTVKLNRPTRREIVWQAERPWENEVACILTAYHDGETFRIFYRSRVGPRVECVMESTDGIHFTRPDLGVFEWEEGDGGKNNIVYMPDESKLLDQQHETATLVQPSDEETQRILKPYKSRGLLFINSVFVDANPEAGADARFKGFATTAGLWPVTSPDGIRWTLRSTKPMITGGPFDTVNIAFWDPVRKVYRAYGRLGRPYKATRTIQTAESQDFIHWSETRQLAYAPGIDLEEDLYTNATSPIPGAEHLYVMFPMRFMEWRKVIDEHPHHGVSDKLLYTSRDGYLWSRPSLEGWLRPDTDPKNWTERNYISSSVVQTSPEEFSIYVEEHYRHESVRFLRYTVRRHRFASMHAGVPGGEFTTRPLVFQGKRLVLNYATSAAGDIRVEIQDADGKPVAGFGLEDMDPLYGNELDRVVTWRSGKDLSALAGTPIRLRFRMQDADLYALRFTP